MKLSNAFSYQTLKTPSESLYKEKGSKFYGYAFSVSSEEEVKGKLAEIRKKHSDARHHCYAYRLGLGNNERYRANDDGEPSNSAGKPIYGQLLSAEITNVLIIVVRYFGGTKLGVGGLISAYKISARGAIDAGEVIEKELLNSYRLKFNYPVMSEVMNFVKRQNLTVLSQDFQETCEICFSCTIPNSEGIIAELENMNGVNVEFLSLN